MTFFLVLLIGIPLWLLLLITVRVPADPFLVDSANKGKLILSFCFLAATISAAATIARRPERWDKKLDRESVPRPHKRPWVWPLFMVLFSVVNYLMALAVFAANLAFTPKKKMSDGL